MSQDTEAVAGKDSVIRWIVDAAQSLGRASLAVKRINALAESVPAIQELDKITRRLGELTVEISRLKGLP